MCKVGTKMPLISVVGSVKEGVVLVRRWELNAASPAVGELCVLGEPGEGNA